MLTEAVISFTAFAFLWSHLYPGVRRWLIDHKGWVDFTVHGTVIYLFIGTFEGLMQAELAAILFSIALRIAGTMQVYNVGVLPALWLMLTSQRRANNVISMRERIDRRRQRSA